MKLRIGTLCRRLFTMLAALSLLLCVAATTLTLVSDHLQRKQVRIGQFEAFWHHDLIIISWGPIEFTGDTQNQWSADGGWIGFDADVVNVGSIGNDRWKWLYTLNSTQVGMMGITAVLPGIWIIGYFWKKSEEETRKLAPSESI